MHFRAISIVPTSEQAGAEADDESQVSATFRVLLISSDKVGECGGSSLKKTD
jgi:hypothetical protein